MPAGSLLLPLATLAVLKLALLGLPELQSPTGLQGRPTLSSPNGGYAFIISSVPSDLMAGYDPPSLCLYWALVLWLVESVSVQQRGILCN